VEITRLPKINEENTPAAIKAIKSYIVRLDRQLSMLLDNVGTENLSPELYEKIYTAPDKEVASLKNEIIETATQIKAISDQIFLRLESDYVAKSDIGQYTESAFQQITVDGKGVTQYFEEMSGISERLDAVDKGILDNKDGYSQLESSLSKINAYIRTGKLDEGIYGIEIGNFSTAGNAPYKVRLSENKLSFYVDGAEVAYFSNHRMYINNASIPNMISIGSCSVKSENGLAFSCK
jgi:hypothetical protein